MKKKLKLNKRGKYFILGIIDLAIILSLPILLVNINNFGDYTRDMIFLIMVIITNTLVIYNIEK